MDQFDFTKSFDKLYNFEFMGTDVPLINPLGHEDPNSQDTHWEPSMKTMGPTVVGSSMYATQIPTTSSPSGHSSRGMTVVIERLSCAQHELLQYRSFVIGASGGSRTTMSSASNDQWVEAILELGQETLGIISSLLQGNCPTHVRGDVHCDNTKDCPDWRTALHFMLTPLSLFLSTYRDILHEIRTVIPPNQSLSMFPDSPLEYQQFHTSPMSKHNIFNTTDIRLGNIRLDRRLQLILLTTVLEYHLIGLDYSLRAFHCQYLRSSDPCMFEGLLSSSMGELRSATKNLLSVTGEILRHPPK